MFICLRAISFPSLWIACSCLLPKFLLESVFVFYCCVIHSHKRSGFTQHPFCISEFWRSVSRWAWLRSLLGSLSQGCNQGVGQEGPLTKGTATESNSELNPFAGRLQLPVALGLRFQFPCWATLSNARPPTFLKVAPVPSQVSLPSSKEQQQGQSFSDSNLSDLPRQRKLSTFMGPDNVPFLNLTVHIKHIQGIFHYVYRLWGLGHAILG